MQTESEVYSLKHYAVQELNDLASKANLVPVESFEDSNSNNLVVLLAHK